MKFLRIIFSRARFLEDAPASTLGPASETDLALIKFDASLESAPSELTASTRSPIGFDPTLIHALLRDHRAIEASFLKVGFLHAQGGHESLCAEMQRLKAMLHSHVLVENVRLYSYLKLKVSDDPDESRAMHEFRRDMNLISTRLTDFLDQYLQQDLTRADLSRFVTEYEVVGRLLRHRIEHEETGLFPVYHRI